MKSAKSYKILFLIAALLFSLVMAFACMGFSGAKADTVNGSDYFSLSIGGNSNIGLDGDNAVFSVTDGDVLTFDNKLNVNGLKFETEIPEEIIKFSIKFVFDPYYVNGNYNDHDNTDDTDDTLETSVERVFTLTKNGAGYSVEDNAFDSVININKETAQTILFKLDSDNYLYAIAPYTQDPEFRIASDSLGFAFAKISVEFMEIEGDSTVDFKIKSVDQRTDDVSGKYKQTFALTDGKFTTKAYPVVELSESLFGKDLNMASGYEYTVSIKEYSLLGESFDSYIKAVDDSIVTKGSKLMLVGTGPKTLEICGKDGDTELVYGSYTVNAVRSGYNNSVDAEKPVYVSDATAKRIFEKAFNEKLTDKDTGTFVALGSSQYLTLPSLKGLIFDDVNSYEDLKLTVHYWTPSSSGSSTTMKIPLTEAGDYKFFITAEDKYGNKMDSEKDFFYYDIDGNYVAGTYSDYIFGFSVEDNYPIKVVAASQGKGYLDVSYTASSFDITSSAYNAEYKLYFSASLIEADDEGWVEIPSASSVTDKEYSENGYTYDDIQSIGYNGSTTFTPDKVGYYKITCTVTSTASNRIESASTVIKIEEQPKVVVVPNHWLRDNVWSVVFLSIGTLCLIGIIVLLCIKPKEEKDND